MILGLAAAHVLALSGAAYAADFGGIQRTVQIWFHGEQTDAVMTIHPDEYTVDFTDKMAMRIRGAAVASPSIKTARSVRMQVFC